MHKINFERVPEGDLIAASPGMGIGCGPGSKATDVTTRNVISISSVFQILQYNSTVLLTGGSAPPADEVRDISCSSI